LFAKNSKPATDRECKSGRTAAGQNVWDQS
jgi:hypothetical protein